MDIWVSDGNLYNFNMVVINEDNNDKLFERLVQMLEVEINDYQKEMIETALKQLQYLEKVS